MSNNPASFRFPYATLSKLPPEARDAHLATFNALTDIYQAFALQKQNSSTSTSTTVNETIVGTTTSGSGGGGTSGVTSFNGATGEVTFFPSLGLVNNQSGNTAYTTQTGDNGAFIILDDASPIAVTLNFNVSTNWYTWIANYGAGTATLTPGNIPSGSTSTITYPGNIGASSMPLASGFAGAIYFDGQNWFGVTISIVTGGSGITQLTGDVTAGPGSGSQAATLATVNPNVGSFTNANITVNSKGLITAAANGSGGSGYTLGGTLSSGNVSVFPTLGTGATVTVSGLDGNHQLIITPGTGPSAGNILSVTFTASRGHTTFPVLTDGGGTGTTEFYISSSSATLYILASTTALTPSTQYTLNMSCP